MSKQSLGPGDRCNIAGIPCNPLLRAVGCQTRGHGASLRAALRTPLKAPLVFDGMMPFHLHMISFCLLRLFVGLYNSELAACFGNR